MGRRWAPRGAPWGADPGGLKRKRLSAQEQSIRKLYPRRKYNIKFEAVEEYNGSALRCIFVPRKQGEQEAVALYPQYRVRWNGADLHMFTWLVVSNLSRWVTQLINICSRKCTRRIGALLFSVVRAEFKACLREANASEHQDANDHEDSDADSVGLYRGEKKKRLL